MYNGEIQIIIAPMYAGKTDDLIRRKNKYSGVGKKCIVVKYIKDTRYGSTDQELVAHNGVKTPAVACSLIQEIASKLMEYDVICIDEAHFIADIVPFCESAANNGKIVIVTLLNTTFQRQPFEITSKLLSLSEDVTSLTSLCDWCHQKAAFSVRISNETQQEVIGGKDKYRAACRLHYFQFNEGQIKLE